MTYGSMLEAIDWGTALTVPAEGTLDIRVAFAPAGNLYGSVISTPWGDSDFEAFFSVFEIIERYIDVRFAFEADTGAADFLMVATDGHASVASMQPPGEAEAGLAIFDVDRFDWDGTSAGPGGFWYATLIHEISHGLGLAHPHDDGGASSVYFDTSFATDTGSNDLNQSVFTIMSYVSGWQTAPDGTGTVATTGSAEGHMGTLGAFDIAVLQDKYGANTSWAGGDTVYTLSEDAPWFETLWDTGGHDRITYEGLGDVVIDLNPASLQDAPDGGGAVSHIWGTSGGFTIANGTLANVIEDASSGAGNDQLTGNFADNTLDAGDGDDRLMGGDGEDMLIGGNGVDTAVFSGKASDYSMVINDEFQTITDLGSDSEFTDTLIDIETLEFSDWTGSITDYYAQNRSDIFFDTATLSTTADGISITYSLGNNGMALAVAPKVGVYVSSDSMPDILDTFAGSDGYFSVAAGDTGPSRSADFSLSGLGLTSQFYVALVADPGQTLQEADILNNRTVFAVHLPDDFVF